MRKPNSEAGARKVFRGQLKALRSVYISILEEESTVWKIIWGTLLKISEKETITVSN